MRRRDDMLCAPHSRAPAPEPFPHDGALRLDHVQVKGTQNGDHLEPQTPLGDNHRYTLAPLEVQSIRARGPRLPLHGELVRPPDSNEDSEEVRSPTP